MGKTFMGKDFMLDSETAIRIYEKYADGLPIIDYHCHISPKEIADNIKYENITRVWLGADHYKWRAMRISGVPEKYITGDAGDYEKFEAWAATMPKLAGSPLYSWSHLELRRYFRVQEPLSPATCKKIWEQCNAVLQDLPVQEMIKRSHVEVIITTDDPADDLSNHKVLAEKSCGVKVLPGFRPDKLLAVEAPDFPQYMRKFETACGRKIRSFADLKAALADRIAYFAELGCRASDHGLSVFPYTPCSEAEADGILRAALAGTKPAPPECDAYRTALLLFLSEEYTKRDWVMELHYGVLRNINTDAFQALGPDTGFDAAGNEPVCTKLAALLNAMEARAALPKTILFSINEGDNAILNTIAGSFQRPGIAGRVQQGAAWWFNDTKTGIANQLRAFSELSVLGAFTGMLTDSRSFLSYTRHEYFRRIFCNFVASLIENGEYPYEEPSLKALIRGVCYDNAKSFFNV
ncbi:MAG: glucuronate isomerase [Clostridia bacterium]